jgi:monolysocardiolipin acyltransferase
MREAVRLMSNPHRGLEAKEADKEHVSEKLASLSEITDPFSSSQLTYTTNGMDEFPAPASYTSRKYSWVHIFPEGRIHQHPDKVVRYFKWGVARLILEPDECPDIVPMWIEGTEEIFHEGREFPRFLPRLGKRVGVWFGENAAGERDSVFKDMRRRWQRLVEQDKLRRRDKEEKRDEWELSDQLKYGKEAVDLRIECTLEVRKQVISLRQQRGLPDEDPKSSLPETWRQEGGKLEGRMDDGSWVKDT